MFTKQGVKRVLSIAITTLAVAGIAACGGSSSSSSGGGGPGDGGPGVPGNTDDIPTTTGLSDIGGLTNHANQNSPLLYIDASHGNGETGFAKSAAPWLMTYDPQNGDKTAVDKDVEGLLSNTLLFPLALHGADVNANTGKMTNYHIDSVVYLRQQKRPSSPAASYCPSELMRIDVGSVNPKQVTNETGCSADVGALSNRQLVAFNLDDPRSSQYVFDSEVSGDWQYKMTPLDAGSATSTQSFKQEFTVQSFLSDAQGANAGKPFGWLVVDKSQNDCLALVDKNDLNSATCIPNADDGNKVPLAQNNSALTDFISGIYLMKNGAIVSLPEASQGNPMEGTSTLWFYQYDPGSGPGELHLLKNAQGDELQTEALPLFGQEEAGRVVNKNGDTLYMALDDGGFGGLFNGTAPPDLGTLAFHVNLVKITTQTGDIGWDNIYHQGGKVMEDKEAYLGDFLVDAGNRLLLEINDQLVSLNMNGGDKELLDGRNNSGGGLISGALEAQLGVTSDNGWFFYNRESGQNDYATAIKVDGSQRVELKNCQWIGASTSGEIEFVGATFASLVPTEMFMACNNKTLAAVDANDPETGKVPLGTLGQQAEEIEMGRAAPGPHRLIRVTYDGAEESYEVVYVDASNKNSLEYLMDDPATDAEVESMAGLTAPINGF